MNLFNTWPERQARLGRLTLLLGWLALIALPLLPISRDGRRPKICTSTPICGDAAPITFIGLVDYLLGPGTSPTMDRTELSAAAGGCRWLTFERRHFRELLDIAPVLETQIIRQLALANRALHQPPEC